jgi:MYXO-CTERM domain-containing protein
MRPPPDATEFAVNQQAEQIIFEVEEGHVVAHVLIRYAGRPENFAWLVPVPSVPELSLSPEGIFGMLDRETAATTSVAIENLCPESQFYCEYMTAPSNCVDPSTGGGGSGAKDASVGQGNAGDASAGPQEPPVQVIDEQVVGDYQTVVFSAGDAEAAVQWLNDNDFITNATMAPYMQPYADAGMLFLASKLVPGAEADAIKPLRMRFEAEAPMIPLQLTAVAAEPHMTITAYIYGDEYYRPKDLPLVELDGESLSRDSQGRINYPMLLSRAIDEAGGRGFVAEYRGVPVVPDFDQGTGCCYTDFDVCILGGDGICQCPFSDVDVTDCEVDETGLVESAALARALAQKHTHLTRLTTRMSPEEMTVDPMFEPALATNPFGRLNLQGSVASLAACESDIIDVDLYELAKREQDCASIYCGSGECVTTDFGAACDCDDGFVARDFVDLDGKDSITCVPAVGPVDLGAGGLALPDVCAGVDCGFGDCIDVGGFPTCECGPGMAAYLSESGPRCAYAQSRTGSAGTFDSSDAFKAVDVCAPKPPDCGMFGWLERRTVDRPGSLCEHSLPDPEDFQRPEAGPTCEDVGLKTPTAGCGCMAQGDDAQGAFAFLLGAIVLLFARRRRARC